MGGNASMRCSLGVAWVVLAARAAAQQPAAAAQEVTLDEAVRRALTVQPAMVQALGTQRNAGASRRSTVGTFLPSLQATASATRSNQTTIDRTTFQAIPPEYSYSAGISANVDLFDGLRRIANLRAANATEDAADAGYVNQRFQTTLQTKQAFFTALANQELVRVAEAQVTRTQLELRVAADKLRAGAATRSDSLRAAVDLGNAQVSLLSAQANLAGALAALGRQIGVDAPVRAAPDTALAPFPDTAAIRATALENSPQVQQADAQARAARSQVTSTRSQYFPTVNVSYSDFRSGTQSPSFTYLFNKYGETYTWRFGLTWTLFNGFSREQSMTSARVARDFAAAQAADTRRSVNAQLAQQLAALAATYTQVQISRANVAAATEDLRVQQERYRVGAGLFLDLLTSQANLTQAQVSLVQARFSYLIARATLEALIGRAL